MRARDVVDKFSGSATRRTLLGLAALLIAWSCYLILAGGFYVRVFGLRLSSREPWRPLALAVILIAIYLLVARRHVVEDLGWTTTRVQELALPLACATALAGGLAAQVWSTHAASGSDAYGYVSQADLWLSGDVIVEQPLMARVKFPGDNSALAPLGYRPGPRPNTIAPTYSPGLPILMAAGKALFGPCAVYAVVPLLTTLLIISTYALGSQIADRSAALAAAVLVACSPIVLRMSMWPMSDVPVAATWTAALAVALGRGAGHAALAGLFGALTVLIRPNVVPLLGVIGVALLVRSGASVRSNVMRAAIFSAVASLGILFIAWNNAQLYGSPFRSGYPEGVFAWHHIPLNLPKYPQWLIQSQTPLVLFALVPLLPIGSVIARRRREALILLFGTMLVTYGAYVAYLSFEEWWYLRFMLPAIPAVLLAMVLGGAAALRRVAGAAAPVIGVLVVIILGVMGVQAAAKDAAFQLRGLEQRYVWIGQYLEKHTPANAVFISLQHSGSIRYYGGRPTLRYDWIENVDRAVVDLRNAGLRPYLLLEIWEHDVFRERFAAAGGLGKLDWPPTAELESPVRVFLYDPAERGRAPVRELIPRGALTCEPSRTRYVP